MMEHVNDFKDKNCNVDTSVQDVTETDSNTSVSQKEKRLKEIYVCLQPLIVIARISGNIRNITKEQKSFRKRVFHIYCLWLLFQQCFHTVRLFFMFTGNEKYGSDLFMKLSISSAFVTFSVVLVIGYVKWKFFICFLEEYANMEGTHWSSIKHKLKFIVKISVTVTVMLNIMLVSCLSFVFLSNIDDSLVTTVSQPWADNRISRYIVILSMNWSIINTITGFATILCSFVVIGFILCAEFGFITKRLKDTVETTITKTVNTSVEGLRIFHHRLCCLLQTADNFYSGIYNVLFDKH